MKSFFMRNLFCVICLSLLFMEVFASGKENGHGYVDLGLPSGTKWATCNIGAERPEEYGDYFAWGETLTKSIYGTTYKHSKGILGEITKYCNSSSFGFEGYVDNVFRLDLRDDVAHVNWGGKWVMPTHTQQSELRNECFWVWTEDYNGTGVNGFVVYKVKNVRDKGVLINAAITPSSYSLSDVHIFLPAAGYRWKSRLEYAGSYGRYWGASLSTGRSYYAWNISFDPDNVYGYCGYREEGLSVRAVFK